MLSFGNTAPKTARTRFVLAERAGRAGPQSAIAASLTALTLY
jgi:hypothetical protein